MKTGLPALLLWLAVLSVSLADESPASRLFAALAGHWEGTGGVRGMASDIRMSWEPVLDGRFLRLTLDNRMTDADGKERRFQAQGFYRAQDDGTIAGTWFDSRGLSFPLAGSADGPDLLTILWGSEAAERGRSSYRLSADGLEVIDEVLMRDGEWRVFGRTRLERSE
jgi:hypothetical protein